MKIIFNKLRLKQRCSCLGYYDRVSIDTHNKVFYIYKLGRYNNKMLYTFGESDDIHATEMRLRSIVPMYEKISVEPVDDDVHKMDKFRDKIKDNVCTFILDESIQVFQVIQ